MRHAIDRRKLSRDTAHRKAMLANLAKSLITHERIETTVPRAKELRRVVEKFITKGKKGSLHDRREVFSRLRDETIVKKVFDDLAPRFKDRAGGYTRIMKKSSKRKGDASDMAVIEFVDFKFEAAAPAPAPKAKKAAKKEEAPAEESK